ncbi:egg cell-secreted protein 1.4 [Ricinus communis]|uniref:Prolamin-like domain-containing protein n=1 Tax=Ricinus communis TaxID=3988 RepID=B9SVP8_RICCO|nr:egg cell-secreted protein 1.4 [Ricinus communis]EEF32307.1 conserved hypothetical protein [Ricinus communis]|eukprot:XP_002530067.1 egg cell-secreted protein 1.4 [Ricinus communis]
MAFKIMTLLLGLTLVIASATAARDVPFISGNSLEARIEGSSSSSLVDCWNALIEIKSCSNEIILFFLNGHTDIGADCCRSIAIFTHNCWPAMLTSIGFTAEEGNILRGYCDNASSSSTSVAPVAAPPLAAGRSLQY